MRETVVYKLQNTEGEELLTFFELVPSQAHGTEGHHTVVCFVVELCFKSGDRGLSE